MLSIRCERIRSKTSARLSREFHGFDEGVHFIGLAYNDLTR